MNRVLAKGLLALVFLGLFAPALAQAPAPAGGALDLYYLGNRASRLEPCGCHSRQQGGVQFEAVIYGARPAESSLRVDLGGWTAFAINQQPVEMMVTRYLLRALSLLGADAVNLGPRDIELTETYFQEFMGKFPAQTPPLVSANIYAKNQPDKPAFAPSRIVKKQLAGTTVTVGITGVCWLFDEDYPKPAGVKEPETHEAIDYVARQPLKCLEPVIAELRPKVDLLIVLSSGPAGSATEIARAFPKVDLVVAHNAMEAPQTAAQEEGTVRMLFGRNTQGREVGHVPLERKDGHWVFQKPAEWLPVIKEVEPKAEFLALIDEFKKETRTLKPKRPPKGVKDVYTGAESCALCHEKQYAAWKKTPHSRAIDILVAKGQQFNPSCLKCHVTGFEQSNGFYSMDHVPSQGMVNVQCEVCHGPGKVHFDVRYRFKAQNNDTTTTKWLLEEEAKAMPHKQVEEKICITCHTPENDDSWDYKKKLPLVAH